VPNKTFPPKFATDIPYPAILNLDALDLSQSPIISGGIIEANTYFNISWMTPTGTPNFTFGKHYFKVEYYTTPFVWDPDLEEWDFTQPLPSLRPGSRILFEFKDAPDSLYKRRVIFSTKSIYKTANTFFGYVWVKVDPLRTYNFLKEGQGTFTIAAEAETTDVNWYNRPNIKHSIPITLNLTGTDPDTGDIYVNTNYSPALFKNKQVDMASGSGLFISESLIDVADVGIQSFAVISASRLETIGGEVAKIHVSAKVSGSGTLEWKDVQANWILRNSIDTMKFEEHIDPAYSQGINPCSVVENIYIDPDVIGDMGDSRKVKFKLEYIANDGDYLWNGGQSGSYFQIFYPDGQDTEPGSWLDWAGGEKRMANTEFHEQASLGNIITTYEGQFNFNDLQPSSISGSGGQRYNNAGELIQYGGGASGNKRSPGGGFTGGGNAGPST